MFHNRDRRRPTADRRRLAKFRKPWNSMTDQGPCGTRQSSVGGRRSLRRLAICGLVLLFAAGCSSNLTLQAMGTQPRCNPLGPSDFFANGQCAQPLAPDTVARGHAQDDTLLYTGKVGSAYSTVFPFPVTATCWRAGRNGSIFTAHRATAARAMGTASSCSGALPRRPRFTSPRCGICRWDRFLTSSPTALAPCRATRHRFPSATAGRSSRTSARCS